MKNHYKSYKESNIQWIGKIPEHWKIAILKRTTSVKGRIGWQGLTSDEYRDEGDFYLVTGTDFKQGQINWGKCWYVDEQRFLEDLNIQLKEDDVLVTKDGTIGKIAFVENMSLKAMLNSGVFVTRPLLKKYYISRYMFWLLNSDLFPEFIEYSKVGTTIAHLYQKVFEKLPYPLPTIPEQELIVSYLFKNCATIDTTISIKKKQLESLESLKKSVIYKAVAQGLDDSVEMKDSGVGWLGEIPRHWKVKILKRDFNVTLGKMLQSQQKKETETEEYYLRSANIQWSGVDISDVRKMWFSPGEKAKLKLESEDLLVSEGGDVGRSSLWREELSHCYIQNAINRVRPKPRQSSNRFLFYFIGYSY